MKIGVTGGIGSGKSLVVDELERLGAVIYRADSKAKELVYLPEVKSKLIDLLGDNTFENGIYNTKFVASIVFANDEMLSKLNQIIHPAVFRDLDKFCAENKDKIIVYESALMIETNHTHLFDKIILVTAPLEVKIERVMKRDGVDRLSVLRRIEKQWSDEQKMRYADFVIQNVDKEQTKKEVEKLWKNKFQ